MHKKGNFVGILLLIVMFVSIIALFMDGSSPTGMVVQEPEGQMQTEPQAPQVDCFGGIPHGSCIGTKPLYCENGQLIYNCYECGCDNGESCGEFGVCGVLEKCADGSFYGECSFLNGKFCQDGYLIDDCVLCGCREGYSCTNSKCVAQ